MTCDYFNSPSENGSANIYGQDDVMKPCQHCGCLINCSTDNFCSNFGIAVKKYCECGEALKKEFIFCPGCGKNLKVQGHGVGSGESPRLVPKQDMLTDVKKRLMSLQEKHGTSTIDNPLKKVKRELVVHIGIKQAGTLKLQKKFGGMKKINLDRHSSYITCIEAICNSFSLKRQDKMFLVDNANKKILKEHFTLETYVKNYNYVGATRLYLVVDLVDCCFLDEDEEEILPPSLTPQKASSTVQSERTETKERLSEQERKSETTCSSGRDTTTEHCPATKEVDLGRCTDLPQNVTLEDVEDYIMQEKAQKRDTGIDAHDSNLSKPGHTPVFFKNVAVKYYVDIKKKEGVDLEVINSAWGPYVQITDEHLNEFFELRDSLDISNMLYLSSPLLFFLKVTELNPINLFVVSESIVRLDSNVYDEFKTWYRKMKEKY